MKLLRAADHIYGRDEIWVNAVPRKGHQQQCAAGHMALSPSHSLAPSLSRTPAANLHTPFFSRPLSLFACFFLLADVKCTSNGFLFCERVSIN